MSRIAVDGQTEIGHSSSGRRLSTSRIAPGRRVSSPARRLIWIRLVRSRNGEVGLIRSGERGRKVLAESSIVRVLVEDVRHVTIRVEGPSGNGDGSLMLVKLMLLVLVLLLLLVHLLLDLSLMLLEELLLLDLKIRFLLRFWQRFRRRLARALFALFRSIPRLADDPAQSRRVASNKQPRGMTAEGRSGQSQYFAETTHEKTI